MRERHASALACLDNERHGGASSSFCLCLVMSPDQFVCVSKVLGLNDCQIMVCEGVGARRG